MFLPKLKFYLLAGPAVLSMLCAVQPAPAETIFRFIDANGVVHFSNAPSDARYRAFKTDRKFRLVPSTPSKALRQTIVLTSLRHQMDPALVRAVIKAESAYDARAVSPKGAMGLMQLMPETASSLQVSNPYDPEQNIAGGARYLRYLLDRFNGNVPLALAAYNAGETRVLRDSRIPAITETRDYVRRVLRYYGEFLKEDGRSGRFNVDSTVLVTSAH
jgi:soluble lytic murein transglycosylase